MKVLERYEAASSPIFVVHSDEFLRSKTQCERTGILYCTGKRSARLKQH